MSTPRCPPLSLHSVTCWTMSTPRCHSVTCWTMSPQHLLRVGRCPPHDVHPSLFILHLLNSIQYSDLNLPNLNKCLVSFILSDDSDKNLGSLLQPPLAHCFWSRHAARARKSLIDHQPPQLYRQQSSRLLTPQSPRKTKESYGS
jgi:hypothetical protein